MPMADGIQGKLLKLEIGKLVILLKFNKTQMNNPRK
jgi:hypothetical protein